MNKALLNRRKRAENRFRLYGKCAIGFALLALTILLVTIVSRGTMGFFQTQIQLTITLSQPLSVEMLQHTDTSNYIRDALLKKFPEAQDHPARRELMGLISSGGMIKLRKALTKHCSTMLAHCDSANPVPLALWLPASDAVDRAIKDHITLQTPENNRKITDRQLHWLESLQHDHAVRLRANPYFFRYGDSREPELAGFMGSIVGSLFSLLTCMSMALPIGVMAAIYLEEFARRNRLTQWIEITINNLAAVPSIVFGLLGLSVYLNVFGVPRSAALAGGLTLALMILPTIIIATRASIRAVPDSIRDAARALGATPLQVVLHHTLPLAVPGIMTGTILGIARAMGETAPLLMIGMVAFIADIPRSPLDPSTAMPVQIYLWSTSPEASFVEKTAAGIVVLLVLLVLCNACAIVIRKKFEHRW